MSSTASEADGRLARTQATRLEILAATRRLILSGESEPTAKQIALSAGITTRTLFRHFPDMNTLYRSFVEAAEAGATQVMDEPFPQDIQEAAQGGWLELLAVVCDRRARVYESLCHSMRQRSGGDTERMQPFVLRSIAASYVGASGLSRYCPRESTRTRYFLRP